MDSLVETTLDMFSPRKTCANCYHNREGHCSMYSCGCATDVFYHRELPRWWTSYEDGEELEGRISEWSLKHRT